MLYLSQTQFAGIISFLEQILRQKFIYFTHDFTTFDLLRDAYIITSYTMVYYTIPQLSCINIYGALGQDAKRGYF